MRQRDRFAASKCERCGKTTPARQNGIGDLYVLPHEWGAPIADQGAFCEPCIARHDRADWLAWFAKHRQPA